MGLSFSGYMVLAVILGAPIAAAAGASVAIEKRSLHLIDAGSVVLPVAAFLIIGAQREELLTGWALVIWPVVILVISLYTLAFKFFVLDKLTQKAKRSSVGAVVVLTSIAVVLAISVPQLPD